MARLLEPLTRGDKLAQFLAEQVREPFVWGATDCALFVADWVRFERGSVEDPAAAYRGQYDSPRGAVELTGGNLVAAVDACATRYGMKRDDLAQDIGAIAVVAMPGGATCAIRTRIGWAMRGRKMVLTIPPQTADIVAAWRFEGGGAHG